MARLGVSEIFQSIQGEGLNIGKPAVFLRLAYCNLRCVWCIGVRNGEHVPCVSTAGGEVKAITEVQVGDRLLALEGSGRLAETVVKEVFRRTVREYYKVRLEGRAPLYFTPEHPVRTWKGWVEVKDLKVGEEVLALKERVTGLSPTEPAGPGALAGMNPQVLGVGDPPAANGVMAGLRVLSSRAILHGPPIDVYNFWCEPHNNFFVDNILVHNCDTKYTWDWDNHDPRVEVQPLEVSEVERRIRCFQPRLLVVTGGEPLLQRHALGELLERLKPDFYIEVETNGTIAPTKRLLECVDRWNVSPKLENSGNPRAKREVAEVIRLFASLPNSVFKFVVSGFEDLPEVERLIEAYSLPRERVLLMPEGVDASTVMARSWELIRHAKRLGVGFTTRLQIIRWGNRRGF